ncbi:MAG: hypothetical protein MUE77_13095 [Sandarakinorhabdus sp.]|jgi:pyruvoyl-dependent arginine decarboxylase (PvlArgDC)|nr:hypothetical protein [Sandarakinorhabdus sp.]
MHAAVKLLTGLAATVVIARGATLHEGQTIMGRLGWAARQALLAQGVADGSVSFRSPGGHVGRIARLSGTADAATRAAVIARLKRNPAIADARWEAR